MIAFSPQTDTIFASDTLPERTGGLMKVWIEDINGVRWYCLDKAYRRGDGKGTHFRRRTTDPIQHARQVIEAQNITGDCSLTSTKFEECIRLYLEEKGAGGFSDACYDRAKKELGNLYPDKPNFASMFAQYCARLESSNLAVNTINNYKIVIRTVCNYSYKNGRCLAPKVKDYRIEQGNERDRILSNSERLSIENKLIEWDSHLYWPFMFALENPIRKRDLFNLKRKDLKLETFNGKKCWVVQFVAQKTGKRTKNKVTTLPNISTAFLQYAMSLPADCEWLFPMVGNKINGRFTRLKPGVWKKIIDADKHFSNVLTEANVQDFHFHDLKHCAETHMLRQGYSYEMLRKLGIQMSPKTARIYDNRTAVEIITSVQSSSYSVADTEVAHA